MGRGKCARANSKWYGLAHACLYSYLDIIIIIIIIVVWSLKGIFLLVDNVRYSYDCGHGGSF